MRLNNRMTKQERYATLSLASIYAFRMLGLFMILPVFAIYAHRLPGSTATLIGLALGIYGLTQALLQIPFGIMSDIIGRKPVILLGLVIFAIGSVVAASAHSIEGIIAGRAIQGAGALGSALTALVADLTREEHRTKAMAMIGMIIALSFGAAMVFGPLFNAWVGVRGIFWITAGLGCIGMLVLIFAVPHPSHSHFHSDAQLSGRAVGKMLRNVELLRLDLGIFMLHAILTATFIAVPVALNHVSGLPEEQQWLIYLPVLILAFICMVPLVIQAESKRRMKQVFTLSVFMLFLTQLLLSFWHHSAIIIGIILFVFFTGFIVLEATLPSMISKNAPAGAKGTAMGIYSSCQFLGIFVGGTIGGWFYHLHGLTGTFLFCAALGFIWLIAALTMTEPKYVSSYMMNIGRMSKADAQQLQNELSKAPGVVEVLVNHEEHVAYLKIDKAIVKPEDLQATSFSTNH